MRADRDPGEGMPVGQARRRGAIAFGILMLILILGSLIWFSVTNTETTDDPPSLFGRAVVEHVPALA